MNTKTCCKCKCAKPLCEFSKLNSSKDGLKYDCKQCRKDYNTKNRENKSEYNRQYFEKHKEKLLAANLNYRDQNKEQIKIQRKQYRQANAEHIQKKQREYLPTRKEKIKERRKNDKDFQLSEILRSKIHKMLKGQETSYKDLIGCDPPTLKLWLQFQFDNNMSWNNIGSYWHVDHVLPINRFDFSKEMDKRVCFHWTNLQPLEKNNNRSKYNHIQLHHYLNQIVTIHRFIQSTKSNYSGYQSINESRCWLREKLRYGKNPTDATMGDPQPSS